MADTPITDLPEASSIGDDDYLYAVVGGLSRKVKKSVLTDKSDEIELTRINAQTGTAYTAALTDRGQTVTMDNASANTFTIPANADVAFDVESVISVLQLGAGVTTIAADTGVTLNGVLAGSCDVQERYHGGALLKIATDTWVINGDVDTVA